MAAVAAAGLPAAEGEEGLTRGLKEEMCPPQLFAMAGSGVGEGGLKGGLFHSRFFLILSQVDYISIELHNFISLFSQKLPIAQGFYELLHVCCQTFI